MWTTLRNLTKVFEIKETVYETGWHAGMKGGWYHPGNKEIHRGLLITSILLPDPQDIFVSCTRTLSANSPEWWKEWPQHSIDSVMDRQFNFSPAHVIFLWNGGKRAGGHYGIRVFEPMIFRLASPGHHPKMRGADWYKEIYNLFPEI